MHTVFAVFVALIGTTSHAADLRRGIDRKVLAAIESAQSAAARAAEAAIAGVPDMVGPTVYADPTGSTGGTGGATGEEETGATGATGEETGSSGLTGATAGETGHETGPADATGQTGGTGGEQTSNCAKGLAEAERVFRANGVTPEALPRHVKSWCYQLFSRRPHISISSHVIRKVCDQSMQIFERRPLSTRYSDTFARSDEFCIRLKSTFDALLAHPESATGPSGRFHEVQGGMPSQAEIQKLLSATSINRAGKTRYCCGPHQEPGCFDTKIAECVCKHDPFCCDGEWDKSCAANVEALLCARCEA